VTRLRAAAGRLRPRSRMGAVGLFVAGLGLVVVVAGLAVAIPWAYGTYGYHPAESAQSWAALTPQYAEPAMCQSCHAPEYVPWTSSSHATVACDSCHGPLAQHAATATDVAAAAAAAAEIEPPTADLCVLCHAQVPGRPLGFPAVDLTKHYAGAPCLGCHEPHATTALRPPDISHALENLPACVTCHKPAGLKPVPVGHEEAPDAVCLTCHQRPTAGQ
jgi:hypothetical protein